MPVPSLAACPDMLTHGEQAALEIIHTWLDYRIRTTDVPGYQVCIRKSGEVIFDQAYGYKKKSLQQPLTGRELFAVGSQTKSYTACIILRLIERGALAFEELAVSYLPELSNSIDPSVSLITIEQLLSHRAGLLRDCPHGSFNETRRVFEGDADDTGYIQAVKGSMLIYPPGSVTKYSNVGYALLGFIAERITGKSYTELVESEIRYPLGCEGITADPAVGLERLAAGYTQTLHEQGRMEVPRVPAIGGRATAGICTNARTSSLFFHELISGTRLLGSEMQHRLKQSGWPMLNMPISIYGYGLMRGKVAGGSYLGHVGEYPGYSTQTFLIEESEYLIGLCMNASDALARDIFVGIARLLLDTQKAFSAHKVTVCRPLVDKFHAFLIAVDGSCAIYLPLDTWQPYRGMASFSHSLSNAYISQTQSGYLYAGEPLRLLMEGEVVTGVEWGAKLVLTEDRKLERWH